VANEGKKKAKLKLGKTLVSDRRSNLGAEQGNLPELERGEKTHRSFYRFLSFPRKRESRFVCISWIPARASASSWRTRFLSFLTCGEFSFLDFFLSFPFVFQNSSLCYNRSAGMEVLTSIRATAVQMGTGKFPREAGNLSVEARNDCPTA
jgi:hypothetical protein